MRVVSSWLLSGLVFASSLAAWGAADSSTPADEVPSTEAAEYDPEAEQPIAIELAQGVELLNQQIADQDALLKTAQTEREQQLIRNHIRLLQKERRSLESLLHKLVGPDIDLLEDRRERYREREETTDELIRDRQE